MSRQRHKGASPIVRELDHFHDRHPAANMIRTGDSWFYAWLAQKCTPLVKLARLTGIPMSRFDTIKHGGEVSRAEIDALARAWSVSSSDLIRSMPDPSIVVE